MNIDELQILVEQRRSIRGYDEKRDVTDETIRTILNCARWAPADSNEPVSSGRGHYKGLM